MKSGLETEQVIFLQPQSPRGTVTRSTHTQPFYGPFSETTWVSRCQKRTSGLYGAREGYQRQTKWPSGWAPLHPDQCPPPPYPTFLQAGCPSYCPTNSVKALKARWYKTLPWS